jgi:glyoxylase-like metal-dependent hydrolase (beta-lactamase superfamily II)
MRWRIGDVVVTKIVELEATGGTRFILPQATREAALQIPWMAPHFMDEDGRLKMSIHALVIEAPGRRMIVDTCLGNDKQGREVPAWNNFQGTFLRDLTAAGFARESIDTVMCTHLHVDHVGWNTMLVDGKWVPTFPKARYLFGRHEYEYQNNVDEGEQKTAMGDSIKPIFDAGLVQLVEQDHVISPEVRLTPSNGHTPGHVSVLIESEGARAVITGDMAHHPCQMAHPDWTLADVDPKVAKLTRSRLFAEWADQPILVIGTHFAAPTAGHIVRDRSAFRFVV